jgi:hypothetical protein
MTFWKQIKALSERLLRAGLRRSRWLHNDFRFAHESSRSMSLRYNFRH